MGKQIHKWNKTRKMMDHLLGRIPSVNPNLKFKRHTLVDILAMWELEEPITKKSFRCWKTKVVWNDNIEWMEERNHFKLEWSRERNVDILERRLKHIQNKFPLIQRLKEKWQWCYAWKHLIWFFFSFSLEFMGCFIHNVIKFMEFLFTWIQNFLLNAHLS